MPVKRTEKEIVARIRELIPNDVLGFEWPELLPCLSFDAAKEFLKEGVSLEDWGEGTPSEWCPIETMHGYMPFAFEKAHGERGISANRSIMHCLSWIWLAGDDDLLAKVQHEWDTNYHSYGLPILRMICEHYGWGAHELGDL